MGTNVHIGHYHEAAKKTSMTNIIQAIAVVIGTFISGATFVPNFAKEATNPKVA